MIRCVCRWLLYMAIGIGVIAPVHAQPSEDDFIRYLVEICRGEQLDIELAALCEALFPAASPVPGAPPPPPPVIGSGMQAAQGRNANGAATQQRTPILERLEEIKTETDSSLGLSRWGWFGSLSTGESKRDPSPSERGYTSNVRGLITGIDYRFSERLVSGVALGYLNTETDFNSDVGRLDTDSQSLTLFATTALYKSSYLDGYVGWAKQGLDTERRLDIGVIDEQISGETDASQMIAGLSGGYQWRNGHWNISADVKMDFIDTEIDAYSDNAISAGGGSGFGLEFSSQKTRSLTGALGGRIGYTKNLNLGVLNPFVQISYAREFQDEGREITSQLELAPDQTFVETTDTPDRNYFLFGVGTTYILPRGLQVFTNLDTISGHRHISRWNLSGGFRLEL